jgi:hypothetical protein
MKDGWVVGRLDWGCEEGGEDSGWDWPGNSSRWYFFGLVGWIGMRLVGEIVFCI